MGEVRVQDGGGCIIAIIYKESIDTQKAPDRGLCLLVEMM